MTVSFDPRDTPSTASAKKAAYISRYKQPGASEAWHFLTGDQLNIDRLTRAAGFRYVWDTETKQFAHPTGVIVLTPDGRLARYLFGISTVGAICAMPSSGIQWPGWLGRRHAAVVLLSLRPNDGPVRSRDHACVPLAAVTTLLALLTFVIVMVRREKRQASPRRPSSWRSQHKQLTLVGRQARD